MKPGRFTRNNFSCQSLRLIINIHLSIPVSNKPEEVQERVPILEVREEGDDEVRAEHGDGAGEEERAVPLLLPQDVRQDGERDGQADGQRRHQAVCWNLALDMKSLHGKVDPSTG